MRLCGDPFMERIVNNMKETTRWPSFALLAFAAASSLLLGCGHPSNSKSVNTSLLMQNVFLDLDVLEDDEAQKLSSSVLTMTNSLDLNRECVAFLKASANPYVTNSRGYVSFDGLFRDAWGNPISFTTTNLPEYWRLNPELRSPKPSLFTLWSSGLNRTNEFGFGDDLFLHR